uniref:Uncharacterized protein n=1 Tax=Rhipicephalus pulchellus TaxID=72859 RepID=L7LXI5_RHIPC
MLKLSSVVELVQWVAFLFFDHKIAHWNRRKECKFKGSFFFVCRPLFFLHIYITITSNTVPYTFLGIFVCWFSLMLCLTLEQKFSKISKICLCNAKKKMASYGLLQRDIKGK